MDVHQPLAIERTVVLRADADRASRVCRDRRGEAMIACFRGSPRSTQYWRELQRRLHGFRPGRKEVQLVEVAGRVLAARRPRLDRLMREGVPDK